MRRMTKMTDSKYTPTRDKIRELEERCKNRDCGKEKVRIKCEDCSINKEYKDVVGINIYEAS